MSWLARLFRKRSTIDDILSTMLANLAVLLGAVAAIGIAARLLPDDAQFAAYGNLRRLNVSLTPILMLGLGMALARHLPFAAGSAAARQRLLLVSSALVLLATASACLLLLLAPAAAARLLLGDAALAPLLASFCLLLAGTVLYSHFAYYFTGTMQMRVANAVQIVAAGVIPIAAVLSAGRSGTAAVLTLTGLGLLLLALAVFLLALWNNRTAALAAAAAQPMATTELAQDPAGSALQLLRYGLPRLPGFVAMAGMMSLGPVLVVHLESLSASVYMVAGLQLLASAVFPMRAMASVFLPRFAQLKAEGRSADAGRAVQLLSSMMLECGIFAALQLAAFVPLLVPLWIRREDPEGILAVTLLAMAVPAYMAYETLRNALDSHSVAPINTYSQLLALTLMLALSYLLHTAGLPGLRAVAIATLAALLVLGLLTLWQAQRLLGRAAAPQQKLTATTVSLLLAGLLGLAAAGFSRVLRSLPEWWMLLATLVFGAVALAAYLLLLQRLGSPWVLELRQRLLRHGKSSSPSSPS